jgi:hypothetical protein
VAAGRKRQDVVVSVRKGIHLLDRAPDPRTRSTEHERDRADAAAYAAAGCDYLVLNLRRAKSPDELVRALEETVSILG